VRKADNLPPYCAVVMKSGNLNFLEPSGPLGTAIAQWLRCCATNRKVAGSIVAGASGFFIDRNPPDCTMALGSTQPLT